MAADAQQEQQREREARWGWRGLGLLALLLFAALTTVFFLNVRPLRLRDGGWTWVRVSTVRWPQSGLSTREYEDFADAPVRREWDLDADGRFECREDLCPGASPQVELPCVSLREEGGWREAPELRSCTELSRLRAR